MLRESEHIEIRPCLLGLGLFAKRHFFGGEQLFIFSGPIISRSEAILKGENEVNALQIAKDAYIDLEPPSVFANHSCAPNAGVQKDRIAIAIADIQEGQEITFDYSTTMSEQRWTMKCLCGSSKCRGKVEDFHLLPDCLKRQYLERGIVQRFIVDEHFAITGFSPLV